MFEDLCRVVMAIGRNTPQGVELLGTCFLTSKPRWFATASHVCQQDDRNLVIVIPPDQKLSDYQDATDPQVKTIPARIVKIDPVFDTAVVEVDQPVASNATIGNLDQVSVGTQVAVFGYPHANFGRKILTMQSAEIGAKILLQNGPAHPKHAVINIQTKPGQSGSPIFDTATRRIVAILVGSYVPGNPAISLGGIDPQTLHQTSHAVSTEYLLGMIE